MKLKLLILLAISMYLISCDGAFFLGMIGGGGDDNWSEVISIIDTTGENLQQWDTMYFNFQSFSHDGEKIIISHSNEIWTANPDGTELECILDSVSSIRETTISPNSEYLVFSSYHGLYKMNYLSGDTIQLLAQNGIETKYLNFSPDGTKMLFSTSIVQEDSTLLQLHTISSDGLNQELIYQNKSEYGGRIKFPVYSSNMEKIFFIDTTQNTLVMINADGTEPESIYSGTFYNTDCISAAASFVVFSYDDWIVCYDFISNTVSNLGYGQFSVISPDASLISFFDYDENHRLHLFTVEIDGHNKKKLAESTFPTLSFSYDSEKIGFMGRYNP